jgi:hypothetical protein
MSFLRKLAVVSLLLSPMAVNADLITADFTGTFRSSDNSLYTEGFQFLFSLTYDDSKDGTNVSQYLDGVNGVGEFGSGDDILFMTYILTSDGGREWYEFDSVGNIVDYGTDLSPYGFQTDNVTLSTNLLPTFSGIAEDWFPDSARHLAGGNGHPNLFFQNNDNFSFGFEWFDDGFFTDTLPDGSNVYGWGSSNWVFRNEDGELLVEQLAFYITDVKYTSVPEPGTLALFSIGLAGMGLARRRKKV